jgi:U6 snRNA-associated Sm-like protein LSm7
VQGKSKKGSILDLNQYLDKSIRVRFTGGREVVGILKGYDPLVNLVLDQTVEYLRDPIDPFTITDKTRSLGLIVCRGNSVQLVNPTEGAMEIENPFIQQQQLQQQSIA